MCERSMPKMNIVLFPILLLTGFAVIALILLSLGLMFAAIFVVPLAILWMAWSTHWALGLVVTVVMCMLMQDPDENRTADAGSPLNSAE